MATRQKVRIDGGYLNAFTASMRGRMGNYGSEMMAGNLMLSQNVLQSSYIHNGFTRLICDKPAEEMTRAGFEIESEDLPEDTIDSVKSRLEELDAVKRLNTALKWRRAFGGSLIVLGLKDGQTLENPLNEDGLQAVEFIRVYDRYEAYVSKYYENPNEATYGKPEIYQINPKTGITSYQVHESRVLVFDGEEVPNDVRLSNQGWGASVIQNCFIQLNRLDAAHRLALTLLERMQQAVHGIPSLSQQVSDKEGEDQVTKRIAIVDAVRGLYNTIAIDAEETYDIKSLTISGATDILDRFAEALSAVTGIPVFILMGRSVGGLNSTGDASKEGWYAQVESWQNDQLRKPLDRLISLIILSITSGKSDGGKYTLEFCPLFTPSDKDKADIELKEAQTKKSEADTLMVLVNGNIMDQDEARKHIAEEYDLVGDAPELEEPALDPLILNEGQKIVPHPNAVVPPVGKK